MNYKKIIPCLDIKEGKVVKGVNFSNIKEVSSPVSLAKLYNDSGADELAFYDITASVENRVLFTKVLKEVREVISIPLIVGGGIKTIKDIEQVLKYGADKVSINTGAIYNPNLILEASKLFGRQRVVLSVDIKQVDGQYYVFTKGGSESTGIEAIQWIKECEELGAGEVVVNSIDTDGVKQGYDLKLLAAVCDAVSIPVIASGGAGSIKDFVKLFNSLPKVAGGLAASVFHFGIVNIKDLKKQLKKENIAVKF